MPELSILTESQRKALIEAVTQRLEGWVDAWERGTTDEEREEYAYYFLAGVCWAQAATEQPLQRDSQTKGPRIHRPGCKSQGHLQCRAGPLWTCRACHRQFCAEDGAADSLPHLCDECWAAATQEGQGHVDS
jgi:hypothetical protein